MNQDLPPTNLFRPAQAVAFGSNPPAILERAGSNALFAVDEFFAGRITNPHTRRAYGRAVGRFLDWCQHQAIELHQVTPDLAGRFLDELPGDAPTKNQALAGLRHFFDILTLRHAVLLNPFSTVRRRHNVIDGTTPELQIHQARELLHSIDTSTVIGLRDRAVLGTLVYTGARVGAIARLRLQDLRDYGDHRALRFAEKGGKQREIPVRLDLDGWLAAYLTAAQMDHDHKAGALFRAGIGGRERQLTDRFLSAHSIRRMLKRRLRDAGLPNLYSPHSFRVLVVTNLLTQDVPLEDVQYLAGHSNPRTTQIYDRRRRRVSRNIVERISV